MIDKEREVYEQYYANAYRGVYRFGDRISQELEESRERIRQFMGAASSDEIIFTGGTTMAINLVANAWGRKHLRPGDEILLNEIEHHANLVPWQWIAQQTGAVLKFIPLTDDLQLDVERIGEVLSAKTRLLAITGMSNVLGTVPPLSEIIPKAKAVGAVVLVDGAQSVPHMPTHVVSDEIDFLAFSGHSCTGRPASERFMDVANCWSRWIRFLCGGHMIERVERTSFTLAPLPARFEAGTLPIAQAIALGTAVGSSRTLASARSIITSNRSYDTRGTGFTKFPVSLSTVRTTSHRGANFELHDRRCGGR